MATLLAFLFLSVLFSFICSVLEAVLLSVTPTFINLEKKNNKKYAAKLEALKNDIDMPLIAILTFNTLAHTVGAIGVGASAEQAFGNGSHIVALVSSITTILILVVSEIIPKTIGATYWKQLAGISTTFLQIIIFPLKWTGIIWLLRLITRLVGGKNAHGSLFSREEFGTMTDIAHEEGVFEESESKIIKNLLRFNEVEAKHIMTPRTVMKIASEEETIGNFFEHNRNLTFSRIPVYKDEEDNITGLVLKDDVLEAMINGRGNNPLSTIKRAILVTRRSIPIPELFEMLISEKNHLALVVDEYGSINGIVTMEDIIETLLGIEILDEKDSVADLQVLARNNWEKRATRMGILRDDNE